MILKSPASLEDVWTHMLRRVWRLTPTDYRRLLAETHAGNVHAGIDDVDGDVLAIGGVFRCDAGQPGTCWLSIAPGLAPQQVVTAALLMRSAIRAEWDERGLVCVTAPTNERGARLAKALGFATHREVGPFVEWAWSPQEGARPWMH